MQLKTITELLHLPNLQVVKVLEHTDTSFHLYIDLVEPVAPICSACGVVHHGSGHSIVVQKSLFQVNWLKIPKKQGDSTRSGGKTYLGSYTGWIIVEDLPLCGKRVFLYIPKRKARCPKDNRIRVEQFDWMRGRFTTRFAEQVYRLTSITTNAEAGWYLNLDDETVYRIDRSMLEELASEKLTPVPTPSTMSVDEVAWQKWHKYVTNVVDIDTRKVIWNHNGRGKSTLDAFFKALGKDNASKIYAVACDGARGFLSSIKKHAKNALIVLDHFHIKSYLNDALDTVRKEQLRKARKDKNAALADLLHCRKRFILMQGQPTERQRNIRVLPASLYDAKKMWPTSNYRGGGHG